MKKSFRIIKFKIDTAKAPDPIDGSHILMSDKILSKKLQLVTIKFSFSTIRFSSKTNFFVNSKGIILDNLKFI